MQSFTHTYTLIEQGTLNIFKVNIKGICSPKRTKDKTKAEINQSLSLEVQSKFPPPYNSIPLDSS